MTTATPLAGAPQGRERDKPMQNGYWHARSLAYTVGAWLRLLEWLRLPGDIVFSLFGAVPVVIALGLGYRALWSARPPVGAVQSSPAE